MPPNLERRTHRRLRVSVPVEIRPAGSNIPIRATTSDLSLSGCYVEMMFTLPAGTNLEVALQIDSTLILLATVVTNDPHVGNGIKFTRILSEDRDALQSFLATAERGISQTSEVKTE